MATLDELRRATLEKVKAANGIKGNYHDETLEVYFEEVIDYIVCAGASISEITSGVVARGVDELWNLGGEGGKLSPYFKQRVNQLALRGVRHG
jgi:hypothetical protein